MNIGDFFGFWYDWLKKIYGISLNEYLWGYNCDTEDFTNPNLFISFAIATVVIALIIGCYYYYVYKPVRNQRFLWFIYLIVAIAINFGWATYKTWKDLSDGLIGNCLVYQSDGVTAQITSTNCLLFGVANGIVMLIVFTFLSFALLKWLSKTGRHYPF